MNWSESNQREIRRIQHYRTKRKGGKYPCNDCEYEAATLATLTTLTPYLTDGLSTKEDKGDLHRFQSFTAIFHAGHFDF